MSLPIDKESESSGTRAGGQDRYERHKERRGEEEKQEKRQRSLRKESMETERTLREAEEEEHVVESRLESSVVHATIA